MRQALPIQLQSLRQEPDEWRAGCLLVEAGGGGFLLLYYEPHDQQQLREALSKLHEIDFGFSLAGSSIIHTDGYDMDEAAGFYSVR